MTIILGVGLLAMMVVPRLTKAEPDDREAVLELYEQAPVLTGSPKLGQLRSVCDVSEYYKKSKRYDPI